MLPIDQRGPAIAGLPGLQQQRVAALPKQRVCRHHAAQPQRPAAERPLAHHYEHARTEGLAIAPRSALAVVDQIREAMGHRRPIAVHRVDALVGRSVGLPARARGLARHRIGAVHASHFVLAWFFGYRVTRHADPAYHADLEVVVDEAAEVELSGLGELPDDAA